MNSFHFPKLIATVWPSLAKETILSKVVNFVDIFKLNLSQGFDDIKKKYIDTILKLDNSKTIMLETKWCQIRCKNAEIQLKKGDSIRIDFSEYQEDSKTIMYMDYIHLDQVPTGTKIIIEQSDCQLEVKHMHEQKLECNILAGWTITFNSNVLFQDYDPNIPFISIKDQKDIIRWLHAGVNMIIASSVKSAHNILELKEFLLNNDGKNVRIIARIETQEALNNYTQILDVCDGITFSREKLIELTYEEKVIDEYELIRLCKQHAKPCIVEIKYDDIKADPKQDFTQIMDGYVNECVDSFLLDEETSIGNDPLESINAVFEFLKKNPPEQVRSGDITPYYTKDETEIIDYIVANAYRITRELYVKAIICYTSNGYVATKLSSMKIDIPVITFTKSDETFRYLTMLRGIKGYKISQGFNYENLKRIGKEMIRITFKGNISLDDKVLIIQANESVQDNDRTDHTQSGMINGVEVYKFKEI